MRFSAVTETLLVIGVASRVGSEEVPGPPSTDPLPEAAPVAATGGATVRSALALPNGVEWHIPVGCGFSGFYTEFLGLVSALVPLLPELRVTSGPCSHEFLTEQLFPEERGPFARAYLPFRGLAPGANASCGERGDSDDDGFDGEGGDGGRTSSSGDSSGDSSGGIDSGSSNDSRGGSGAGLLSGLLLGVDLPGGDLPRFRDGVRVASAAACDCLCRRRAACVGWTFREADGKSRRRWR